MKEVVISNDCGIHGTDDIQGAHVIPAFSLFYQFAWLAVYLLIIYPSTYLPTYLPTSLLNVSSNIFSMLTDGMQLRLQCIFILHTDNPITIRS